MWHRNDSRAGLLGRLRGIDGFRVTTCAFGREMA